MADADPTAGGANRLTWAELIRAEIEGKDKALKGYDEILWKIRSGYAVILYGALTLALGQSGLSALTRGVLPFLIGLIVGLSAVGSVIDYTFLMSKLRVVIDKEALTDLAVDLATGVRPHNDLLKALLHVSGESGREIPRDLRKRALWPVVLIYLLIPLIVGLVVYWLIPETSIASHGAQAGAPTAGR